MKKFYTLCVAITVAMLTFAAKAATITFEADNAAAIESATVYSGGDYTTAQPIDGKFTIEIDPTNSEDWVDISMGRGYELAKWESADGTKIGSSQHIFGTELAGVTSVKLSTNKTSKTITIEVDNANACYVSNSSSYESYYFYSGNSVNVTLYTSYTTLNVYMNDGFEFVSWSVDGQSHSSSSISYSELKDGDKVTITTKKAAVPQVTVSGQNFTAAYNYSQLNPTNGVISFEHSNKYANLQLTAAAGYGFESVTINGNEQLYNDKYSTTVNIYGSNITGENCAIVVKTVKLDDVRNAAVKISVEGSTANLQITRNNDNTPIATSEFANLKFIPGSSELPLIISTIQYGTYLYKVTVNGVEQSAQGGKYYLSNLKDGDEINIIVDFPDKDVPVKFTLAEGIDYDIIASLTVNGTTVSAEEFTADGFTVKLGSTININFNTQSYNISSVTVNGQYGSTYSYSGTVSSDNGLDINISATAKPKYKLTVNCNDPEAFYFEANSIKYTVTESGSVIEFPEYSYITLKANQDFIIASATDSDNNSISSNFSIYGDMTITIETEKLIRDKQLVVYVEEADWSYRSLTLSANNYDITVRSEPAIGYNFYNFGSFDLPLQLGAYIAGSSFDIYVDGEKVTDQSAASYPGLRNINDGTVIKMLVSEPAAHNVTVNTSDGIEVETKADYVTGFNGRFTTLGDSHILITPTGTTTTDKITVKVGENEFTANENGQYIVPVTEHTTIDITANNPLSISEITTDSNKTVIYDLSGRRVSKPTHGLYIVNGKKVIL